MFGMSMTEMMIIAVVALLILGPKELPKAAKTIGKALRDVRRASDDLRDTFEREMRDEPPPPKPRPPEGAVVNNAPPLPPPGLDQPEAAAAAASATDPAPRSAPDAAPAPKDA